MSGEHSDVCSGGEVGWEKGKVAYQVSRSPLYAFMLTTPQRYAPMLGVRQDRRAMLQMARETKMPKSLVDVEDGRRVDESQA